MERVEKPSEEQEEINKMAKEEVQQTTRLESEIAGLRTDNPNRLCGDVHIHCTYTCTHTQLVLYLHGRLFINTLKFCVFVMFELFHAFVVGLVCWKPGYIHMHTHATVYTLHISLVFIVCWPGNGATLHIHTLLITF